MGTKPRHPHKAGGAEVPRRAAHGPTDAFSSRPSMPQGTPRDAAAVPAPALAGSDPWIRACLFVEFVSSEFRFGTWWHGGIWKADFST
jgi:hypothetical protein